MSGRGALVVLLSVLVLLSCGTATVDGETVADGLDAEFEERTGVPADLVSCPETIPRAKGEKFECTVLVGATTAVVNGTMTDNEGSFDWAPERGIVDGKATAAEIQSELGPGVQVSCDPVVFADPGDTFTCEVVESGGVPANINVAIEEDGSITWSAELD